jgi:ATP-binding cassette subfamily B protein
VARKQRKVEGHMANTAAEALSAIQTVQAYGLGDSFSEIFGGAADRDLKEGVKGKRLSARLERTADVLSALAQALVILFGAQLVLEGELTVGALLVFVSYLKSGFRPVRNFAKYSARIARASAAAERVLELLELEPDVRDREDAVPAPPLRGDLRFEGVHYAYEGEHRVLHDISFDIPRGSRVAVVGPSGSGKSTLMNLCLRLADPVEGSVKIDGHDLREFELESVRAQISVALQDPILFASSIRENIAMGAEGCSDEDVEKAARLVNAHDFILAQPEGYDTVVGERGVTLSRGQRQRIALARAAVRSAPILLLDEPFTGLDEESRVLVREASERLAQDRTTLLVTHDVNEARSCERILVIDNGRLVEEGSHEELMAKEGRYATLFATQSKDADIAQSS